MSVATIEALVRNAQRYAELEPEPASRLLIRACDVIANIREPEMAIYGC